jgi:uncharacterized membrane protein
MNASQTLSPILAIHVCAALLGVVLGPFAIWARLLGRPKPKLHRAFGYAWVTVMLMTATTAIGIQTNVGRFRWHGYSAIHLLIIVIYVSLFAAFWCLQRGNVRGHKITMIITYVMACLVTGAFTLSPGRFMNAWLFS